MTEQTNNLAKLFAACWKDADLKARFMADPASVLAEYGMEVPEGTSVNVVENSDSTVHITLPLPPTNHHELPDDMLETIAGGVLPTKFLGPSGGWTSEEIAQVFAVDTGSEKGSTWPMPKFRF